MKNAKCLARIFSLAGACNYSRTIATIYPRVNSSQASQPHRFAREDVSESLKKK